MRRTAYAVVVASVALAAPAVASGRIAAIKGFGPGAGRVVTAHDDGSHVRRLASGDEAWISPDGRRVAVEDSDPGQQIFHPRLKVYRAGGGPPLFVIRRGFGPIEWSPDSTMLVTGEQAGISTTHLVVIDAKTGARTRLLTGELGSATFSPDATQIAFIRYDIGDDIGGILQVMDRATRTVRTLAEHVGQLAWGPHEIAFSRVSGNDYGFANIAAIQPDGSGFRWLTHVAPRKASGFAPVDWSADGTRLLASYYRNATPISYAIDAVNGGARRIARGVYPRALSRDGLRVIGGTGNPYCCDLGPINVVRVPWTGGKPHILIRKAFRASSNE